jgi:outer membrane protein assembly factor BamB
VNKLVVVTGALLVFAGWAWAADWPQFRGPDANGISPETGLNTDWAQKKPAQLWKVTLGDDGFGGPAVANGKVFYVDHNENQDIVRVLDLTTGKELWQYAYEESGGPNYGFNRATPCVKDGMVYTVSMKGVINCLAEADGKVIWQKKMADFGGRSPSWAFACSPIVDGENVILVPGGQGASVVAVDRKTGNLVWKSGTDRPGYSTPVIATINGVKQYLVFSATSLNGYAADGGKKLWSFPWKTSYDVNAAAPIAIGDTVFISSGYETGCALVQITSAGAKQVWVNKAIQLHFSSPVLIDGRIYSTTDNGDLVCLDPKTGSDIWRHKGKFEKGGLVAADGVLYVMGGADGRLVLVQASPDAYKELSQMTPLGGQSWTAPVIADGKVIVRNKQAMVCLVLK